MKILLKCLITGSVLLLLTACAAIPSTKNYEKLLASWVGATELALVRAWGTPKQIYKTGGRKFFVYSTNSASKTIYSHTTNTASTIRFACKTTFELSGEVIKSWKWQGNNCSAHRPADRGADYYSRGNAKIDDGNYARAILDYNKIIELRPDYADAYLNRGIAYAGLKEHNKAILDYNKAIQLNPDDAAAYHNRGETYADLKEHNKAILDYNKAIELKPNLKNELEPIIKELKKL